MTKLLTVTLHRDEFKALDALAKNEERTATQQATWLLRWVLKQRMSDQRKGGSDDD